MPDALQMFLNACLVAAAGLCWWLDYKLDAAKEDARQQRERASDWQSTAARKERSIDDLHASINDRQRQVRALLEARIDARGRPSRAKDIKAMQDALAVLNGKG